MKRIGIRMFAALCPFFLAAGSSVALAWTEHGVPVCAAAGNQNYARLVEDGAGGAIVAWRDYRNGNYDVYCQRVDAGGRPAWQQDGVPVCTQGSHQYLYGIISDGRGGAIMVWEDLRDGRDIYAQRIDSRGVARWTANGKAICTAAGSQYEPAIAPDGEGGAIIAWIDSRNGTWTTIYAQRISASGSVQWTSNGIWLSGASVELAAHQYVAAVSDEANGAIVVWQRVDNITTAYSLALKRVNSAGSLVWYDEVLLWSSEYHIDPPSIVSDGKGGAYLSWYDQRWSSSGDVFAEYVKADGTTQWGLGIGGITISDLPGSQFNPRMVLDGDRGVYIVWEDFSNWYLNNAPPDLFAQHLSPDGRGAWGSDGIPVCLGDGHEKYPDIVLDDTGRPVICWQSWEDGSPGEHQGDVLCKRLTPAGGSAWAVDAEYDGVYVCQRPYAQQDVHMINGGPGGVILSWHDWRNGSHSDIYAQRMNVDGGYGIPAAAFESIVDVASDQGGWIDVVISPSPLDNSAGGNPSIDYYALWRRTSDGGAAAIGAPTASSEGLPAGRWESLLTWPAVGSTDYRFRLETRTDSSAAGPAWEVFVITAHTGEAAGYAVSVADSGYSVDNIAPAPPSNLHCERDGANVLLWWQPSGVEEIDLYGYALYRGTESGVEPEPAFFVATTADTVFLDEDAPTAAAYYIVTALDIHDNNSFPTNECFASAVSGTEDPRPPVSFALYQNAPNPFNPSTLIRYDVPPGGGRISLRIYDTAGRLVKILVDESGIAGRNAVSWHGLDEHGKRMASGVYFCRMTAPGFEQTRKLVLLQ